MIDLNSISSFPIVPQFNFDFSPENRAQLIAPISTQQPEASVEDDDFGEFAEIENKVEIEPSVEVAQELQTSTEEDFGNFAEVEQTSNIENVPEFAETENVQSLDKYSAIKELEPNNAPNLMELSTLDSFTADSISKKPSIKPVISLSNITRLKTSAQSEDEDFGDFEVASEPIASGDFTQPIKSEEPPKSMSLDFAKVAQQLEKTNDRQNMFDLLADVDFSAPVVENAVIPPAQESVHQQL